jgi:spore photoproduct lyase
LKSFQQERLWISTGLVTDSLLAEQFNPQIADLSTLIPENAILELRTKSADTSLLENPAIDRTRVVVAWSLNPESIATKYEFGTATVAERINASQHAVSLGYRVAFHFDPVFYFDGCGEAYENLIDELKQIPNQNLAFFSVGLFRYMPDLGAVIRQRFPYHEILTGEFFRQSDGKYHYLRHIRKEMYRNFQLWLEPWSEKVPVFWSMEPDGQIIATKSQSTQ